MRLRYEIINIYASFIFYSLLIGVNGSNFEQELLEDLLRNYNRKMRPPGTVQVKFALNLNQIINLIEKDQIIVINAFIDHEW
jgi:hypothetical protein